MLPAIAPRALARAIAATAFAALAGAALPAAAQTPPAFSATARRTLPDGAEQVGRIMKSGDNMRIEMQTNGRTAIQILRGGDGIAYLIDPASRTYAQIADPSVAEAVQGASTPCPPAAEMQAQGLSCQPVGQGQVSGIRTQTWQITAPGAERPMVVEWDSGRRRALVQTWPDGTRLSLTFQAMQDLGGRPVEHWISRLERPGQPAQIGGWWFDPELRVVVREDMPGGITRSLEDIRVGPLEAALFEPPAGYTRVEPQPATPTTGQ